MRHNAQHSQGDLPVPLDPAPLHAEDQQGAGVELLASEGYGSVPLRRGEHLIQVGVAQGPGVGVVFGAETLSDLVLSLTAGEDDGRSRRGNSSGDEGEGATHGRGLVGLFLSRDPRPQ